MKIAVITGASSGMGREFARRIDGQTEYDEIWLIARRKEKLEELASGLRAKARILALDLCDRASIDVYRDLLEKEKPEISVLVNAAGFGLFGTYTEMDLSRQLDIIELNDRVLVAMTYITLPYMPKGSCIYQLGSLSAFQPVPYINVYGASKAFVLSFSRSLNVELRGDDRGIRVMCVCPGWVKTEFFDHAVHDDTVSYYNRYYTAEQVVDRALKDMERGRDLSICGQPVRTQAFFVKLLPHKLVMKTWCKQQKKKF